MTIKRLFDAVDYQIENFSKQDMLVSKVDGKWKPYSTKEVKDIADCLSAGLLELGISGNDFTPEGSNKVAIISNNCPEWIFVDLAVQQTGAILVPLYPTTIPSEIEFILNETEVKFIFVDTADQYEKIKSIQANIPSLKGIYTFDHIDGAEHWSKIINLVNKSSLERIEVIKSSIPVSHVATIIYTSGTTGQPKGVMLTHANIYTNIMYSKESFPFNNASDKKALSFLPLNHIFEKVVTYIYFYSGISVYYAENLDTIGINLREVKPFIFTTVPRLLEKVYERILATGNRLSGIKRSIFFWAVALGKRFDNKDNKGWLYKVQLVIANKLVFNKWRKALGGNIKYVVTGGAACPEKILRIFCAANISVYEGYGPTENSPVISVNRIAKNDYKFGTVGLPINGIKVKLQEDGEICVKGPTVMKGYYKQPGLTTEVIIDGWLYTGDIGVWIDDRFLKITDRKKELFKTSGGKYVAPQPIESKCKENPFIEQIIVLGPERKFVSALIVPCFEILKGWMEYKGMAFTNNTDIVNHPEVVEKYQSIIDKSNQQLNPVEQIKKFVLLPKEWNIEDGEMTPKLSLKRKTIMDKYNHEIENIYL